MLAISLVLVVAAGILVRSVDWWRTDEDAEEDYLFETCGNCERNRDKEYD